MPIDENYEKLEQLAICIFIEIFKSIKEIRKKYKDMGVEILIPQDIEINGKNFRLDYLYSDVINKLLDTYEPIPQRNAEAPLNKHKW